MTQVARVALSPSSFTGNCPILEFTGEEVVLRDDHGNAVHLTPAQWSELVRKVRDGDLGSVNHHLKRAKQRCPIQEVTDPFEKMRQIEEMFRQLPQSARKRL